MTTTEEDLDKIPVVPQITTKFVTKKFVLKSLLDKAMVVLPTTDTGQAQVLKNFQIEATGGKSPKLKVAATDLDLWALASTNLVEVEGKGATIVLPGTTLAAIIDSADDGDLVVDVDAGVAKISVKRTQWDLRLPDGSKYPLLPSTSQIKFFTIARGPFIDALMSVRKAASTEEMRQSLRIIDIRGPVGNAKFGRMRASDGGRYHQVKLLDWPKGLDLQIPVGAADVLMKLLRSTEVAQLDIGETPEQIVFRLGADIFVAAKLIAEFPNVDDRLLKPAEANDHKLVVDRQELLHAIRRVRITSDPQTSALALVLSPGHLSVRSKDDKGNTCSEDLDVSWEEKGEKTVGFNHKHLIDMVSSVDSTSCTFFLGKDTKQKRTPLLLRDESSGTIGVLSQQRPEFTR